MAYSKATISATEIETQLRAYLDDLVSKAGGPLTVWRIASLLTLELRAHVQKAHPERLGAYPDAERIIEAVSLAHGIPVDVIRGRDRSAPIALARHHATWELRRRRLDFGLCKIAAWLDRTDHSTVINSLRRFEAYVAKGLYVSERAIVEDKLTCK